MTGKSHSGFTLAELLIVLVIVAILAVVAVPPFISHIQTSRLSNASQNLYYALQYARSEAIKRNVTMFVSFQPGTSWCYGVNPSTACNCSTASSCALGATNALGSSQLSLSATGLSNNALSFEPNHGAAGSATTITLSNAEGNTMSVQVKLMGSLLLCSSQISGYPACT